MAMAMWDSVTVSMAALMMGMLRWMLRVSCVWVLALAGTTSERAGSSRHIVEGKSFGNREMNHIFSRENG